MRHDHLPWSEQQNQTQNSSSFAYHCLCFPLCFCQPIEGDKTRGGGLSEQREKVAAGGIYLKGEQELPIHGKKIIGLGIKSTSQKVRRANLFLAIFRVFFFPFRFLCSSRDCMCSAKAVLVFFQCFCILEMRRMTCMRHCTVRKNPASKEDSKAKASASS